MLRTVPVLGLCLALLTGCGDGVSRMEDPVEISGKATYADGRPVRDVQLALRPKGEGHPAGCALGSDGSFTVKAVPGEFMFFFQPLEGSKDKAKVKAGFATIPTPYQDVNVDHTVKLKSGGGNEIKLK
jgi:hypothetical protein